MLRCYVIRFRRHDTPRIRPLFRKELGRLTRVTVTWRLR